MLFYPQHLISYHVSLLAHSATEVLRLGTDEMPFAVIAVFPVVRRTLPIKELIRQSTLTALRTLPANAHAHPTTPTNHLGARIHQVQRTLVVGLFKPV